MFSVLYFSPDWILCLEDPKWKKAHAKSPMKAIREKIAIANYQVWNVFRSFFWIWKEKRNLRSTRFQLKIIRLRGGGWKQTLKWLCSHDVATEVKLLRRATGGTGKRIFYIIILQKSILINHRNLENFDFPFGKPNRIFSWALFVPRPHRIFMYAENPKN